MKTPPGISFHIQSNINLSYSAKHNTRSVLTTQSPGKMFHSSAAVQAICSVDSPKVVVDLDLAMGNSGTDTDCRFQVCPASCSLTAMELQKQIAGILTVITCMVRHSWKRTPFLGYGKFWQTQIAYFKFTYCGVHLQQWNSGNRLLLFCW